MAPTPQPCTFALGTSSHHHLELDLRSGADGHVLPPVEAFADLRSAR